MTTQPPDPPLIDRVRAWLREEVPWPAVLAAGVGVSTVALLSVAGLSPLLAAVATGDVARPELIRWVTDFGGNALAGWVGSLAIEASLAPFRDERQAADPVRIVEVARQLQQRAKADAQVSADLARLFEAIEAAPNALARLRADLAAVGEEIGAQSDLLIAQQTLLSGLYADVRDLARQNTALQSYIGTTLRVESDRVIAALADRNDENLAQVLGEIRRLREELIGSEEQVHTHRPVPAPSLPAMDLDGAIAIYLQQVRNKLDKTDVVPIRYAHASADTRDYVPLQVHSPQNAAPEPVFAALAGLIATQRPAGLLVIGDAGSGKSHTLHYAALLLAQAWPSTAPELQADLGLVTDKPLLPVYVQLQALPRCRAELSQSEPITEPTLAHLIDRHLCWLARNAEHWRADLIRALAAQAEYPCLFLFDGLDEIDTAAERGDFQQALLWFQRNHPQHVFVVTSRPLPDQRLGAEGFVERRLLPMQTEQMRRILINWHRAKYGAESLASEVERQADDLLATIQHDTDLAPMASNPLFLTAMARMALSSVGLPRLKVSKYSQMVDLLLDWRRNRIRLDDRASLFADVRHRAALGHLARFAACMLTLNRHDLTIEAFVHGACVQELPPPVDEDPLDADAIEELLRSVVRHTGLLVENGGRYRFTFGFGSYLAACAHARFADVVERLFKRHAEQAWRATIIMTIGYMMNESAYNPRKLRPLFAKLLSSGPEATLLAAEALCETIDWQSAGESGQHVSELAREGRQVLARLREMKADPALIRRLEPFEEGGA